MYVVFFFKQKTAYELHISDWSSDVCSSDLGMPRQLVDKRGLGRADQAALGDEKAGCDRHDKRRDLADKTIADRQCRIGVESGADIDAMDGDADDQADDDVYPGDQQARHGIAAHEFGRSEEHTSELQSLMSISYAVFCLQNKKT